MHTYISLHVQADFQTPDNLFPPLRFGSPSSPGGSHHPVHVRTNSNTNTPSRLRSATLQSPIKDSFTTPPQRLRSATVESSNTFGTCIPAPSRVIARDFATLPAIRPVDDQVERYNTSQVHRRRPSKLTLRTTNLSRIQPGETTPTPQNLKSSSTSGPYLTPLENPHPASAPNQRTRNARERRRSRSTGDLESLVMRQGNHRSSRSESHKLAAFPVEVGGSDTESREVFTPASILSVTSMISDATISPDKPTGSGSRFENVPLPWSTHPLSTLLPTLPHEYLSRGHEALLLQTPHILAPHTLLALSSEEDRLQLELERLKVKHTTLSQRRDKLISRLGLQHHSGDIFSGLQAVQETIGRVDRVARQIYICNDQVRQMEVMKRDHEVGVLLWALEKSRVEKEDLAEQYQLERYEPRIVDMRDARRVDEGMAVPAIQLTRATLYDVEDDTPEDDGYEILNSPLIEQEEESYAEILSEKESRPMSTISIASGRFGFPLPPSRPSIFPHLADSQYDHALSPKTDSHGHEFDDAETECDYDSSFGHEPDLQAVNHKFLHPHNITIYPPGQGSYQSQTYPSSPHTPHGSTDSHSHSTRDHDRLPLPLARRLTPLSARRSKPDLTIPIPRRPSSRRPPSRQKATSPLRLAPPKSKAKAKTRSLQSNMDGLMVSGQEKFLRARESRLEDNSLVFD